MFLRDPTGALSYEVHPGADDFHLTMMSRKGLLPEADFYCPIPYAPLRYCTVDAVHRLIADTPDRLLDEIFELFKREVADADPEYAARTGIALATVEDIADRYFAARLGANPFAWAARNLAEAKQNKKQRVTVGWRYAILRMHEVIALAVPHFNAGDLMRFHKHFKTVFVDDYATVPHESVERLLALHTAGKLSVMALGDDYDIERSETLPGVTLKTGDDTISFTAFIDATGQHALSASDLPFPSLRQPGTLKEAQTKDVAADGNVTIRRTGGIDIDDDFRPRVSGDVTNKLYCVSVPFLLHKLPFVQGITSAHEMGAKVAKSIVQSASGAPQLIGKGQTGISRSPIEMAPDPETAA